ncbi:MAG: metal-dependent transcriptional regulator [Actinomycetota bacterium]|nr:metal-dependent transcriptional regulator [Actinomycetota bacterium]
MTSTPTPAVQDYVKTVWAIESADGDEIASTSAVAQRLGVSAASATNMLKKLDALGLVAYVPYRGASLTEAGRKIALEVIRHHRLLETYLAEALGVPWDKVHDEAEILEHALSEDLEERIAAHLGHPTRDPHGHPIPTKDGSLPDAGPGRPRKLWDVAEGEKVSVGHVPDGEAKALRYFDEVGIRPGARLDVVDRGPVEGPVFVRVDEGAEVTALSRELSEAVWVF